MPFTMKIQPIDFQIDAERTQVEPVKPIVKSRLKQLIERQFPGVLRISASEKISVGVDANATADFEPSSVSLAKMVTNYIEENHEKQSVSVKCGRNRCNCFNRNCEDSSDDELDTLGGFGGFGGSNSNYSPEILKGLVACKSVGERNLLADTSKIVDKNKTCKRKDSVCKNTVTEALLALGYDASICKSRWEKSPSYPAGEYEYIDVIIGNERLIIDIDFKSEFEIARSTKAYKTILQNLPYIFVGTCDRLERIVAIVSEAAKQSLKKKGMHVPPWRRVEYVKAKWFSTYTRITQRIREERHKHQILNLMENCVSSSGEEEKTVAEWKPPELKPKGSLNGVKVVTGLTVANQNPEKVI